MAKLDPIINLPYALASIVEGEREIDPPIPLTSTPASYRENLAWAQGVVARIGDLEKRLDLIFAFATRLAEKEPEEALKIVAQAKEMAHPQKREEQLAQVESTISLKLSTISVTEAESESPTEMIQPLLSTGKKLEPQHLRTLIKEIAPKKLSLAALLALLMPPDGERIDPEVRLALFQAAAPQNRDLAKLMFNLLQLSGEDLVQTLFPIVAQ